MRMGTARTDTLPEQDKRHHTERVGMTAHGDHKILIGLGSNLQPSKYIPEALRQLQRAFSDVTVSTLYRTRPLNERYQPAYINGVVAAVTELPLTDVRAALNRIEDACARERDPTDAYASRTLDLDLLAYDDEDDRSRDLPADDLLERDFCLIPAAELWPRWRHPRLHETLEQLAHTRFPCPPNILHSVSLADLRADRNG